MLRSLSSLAELSAALVGLLSLAAWVVVQWRWQLAPPEPRLAVARRSAARVLGLTTTADNRLFALLQPPGPAQAPQVGEWPPDGRVRLFPTAAWNRPPTGASGHWAFVHATALRVGPDGRLWVLDAGRADPGAAALPEGPKLVCIELITNRVISIYPLGEVAGGPAYFCNLRLHGRYAYLLDSGRPALVVLDLQTGQARRVLRNHFALVAGPPSRLAGPLELSPDGRWLYFGPAAGPLSRIATHYLNDLQVSEVTRAGQVKFFAAIAASGGTALDARGTLYLHPRGGVGLVRVSAAGHVSDLTLDARLASVEALWLTRGGDLLAAAPAPADHAPTGEPEPAPAAFVLYRLRLGRKPARWLVSRWHHPVSTAWLLQVKHLFLLLRYGPVAKRDSRAG